MELPASLMGAVVGEGEKYFFTVDCPIGVQEHIHICIKRNNKILLFSTCSSQTDTAFRLAKLKGLDNVIEVSEAEFGKLIKDGKVHRLGGKMDELSMTLIANGVKLSPEVERRIKDLF